MTPARPGETPAQKADRNFSELLQELRVTQAGVQILFAFLLVIPVQAGYDRLDVWDRRVLVAALLLSALAAGCLIAPVAYHRVLFSQRMKDEVVQAANRFARAGLALLLLAICASLELVLRLILGLVPALVITALVGLTLISMWWIAPALALRRNENDEPAG